MNPYARFRTISIFISAGILFLLAVVAGPEMRGWAVTLAGESPVAEIAILAGATMLLVTIWAVLAELILPAILRSAPMRGLILGRHHVEGTWLEARRGGETGPRLAIVTIKSAASGLVLTSATLTRTGEIEQGTRSQFLAWEWPNLQVKYRETMTGTGEGVGEFQFDATCRHVQRYSGYLQTIGSEQRIRTEGLKLTGWRERYRLRSAEGRRDMVQKYWAYFFEGPLVSDGAKEARLPKRSGFRRSPDAWRRTDATPTADRIREQKEPGEAAPSRLEA